MHHGSHFTATLLLALVPQAANAGPLISEVLYDAVGSDNGLVFVELYGTPGASLDGLFLEHHRKEHRRHGVLRHDER